MQKASPGRISEKPRNSAGRKRGPRQERAVGDLAFEGFGGGRFSILEALAEGELRYTDIARQVAASEGEVSRHLARMARAGLLEKRASGRFRLTALGHTLQALAPPLKVLTLHRPFFRSHDLSGVPRESLMTLDALATARLLTDPLEIGAAMGEVFGNIQREFCALWVIGRAAVVQDRIAVTAPLRAGVARGSISARCVVLRHEAPLLAGFGDPLFLRGLGLRLAERLPASLLANETAAAVGFPDNSGAPDFDQAFYGKDPRFVKWAWALFEEAWAAAALP